MDEELETRVRLAELDLTDDYVFARLNAVDRERFERKVLHFVNRMAGGDGGKSWASFRS